MCPAPGLCTPPGGLAVLGMAANANGAAGGAARGGGGPRPGRPAFSVAGLLVAAPLTSVESFAGIVNIVLFPMLFLSGALYPTERMPSALRAAARLNPVSYAVDLMRAALGQPSEFGVARSIVALTATTVLLFLVTIFVFDPERRVVPRDRPVRA